VKELEAPLKILSIPELKMKSVIRRFKENKLDVCVWAGKIIAEALLG